MNTRPADESDRRTNHGPIFRDVHDATLMFRKYLSPYLRTGVVSVMTQPEPWPLRDIPHIPKKPFYKKKWFLILVVVVVVLVKVVVLFIQSLPWNIVS